MLRASDRPLAEVHDLAVLDLDGVLYVGPDAVPGAVEALDAAAGTMRLAYVTNNAARTPDDVAAHLRELGFPARPDDVVTSAQAAARVLGDELDPGARVYVLGGDGLRDAVARAGFAVVTEPGEDIAAVVQGYGPDVVWREVIDGAILVRNGLVWVASNTDLTIPTAHGVGPGNGALVDLVARFAGRQPKVAGKPEPPLFEETLDRLGASAPLVIGDRLDTDIAGARRLDWPALLVMTGVTGVSELVQAAPEQRPTYVAADLHGLTEPHPPVNVDGDGWRCEGWLARVDGDRLDVSGSGSASSWWRVVAAAGWAFHDDTGRPVQADGLRAPR